MSGDDIVSVRRARRLGAAALLWRGIFLLSLPIGGMAWATPSTARYPKVTVQDQPPVTVFDYQTQRCDDIDIPDSMLRAFRRDDGMIVGYATHYRNRRFIGKSLLDLKRDCKVAYEGQENPDASAFNDRTWVASTWSDDGRKVIALGHNEYQGQRFPGKCRFGSYHQCWYNAIVLLQSLDAGESFFRVDRDGPMPLIAPPQTSQQYQGHPGGYFEPSNIVAYGSYYYALVSQKGLDVKKEGRCLLRAKQPDSLDSWQFFDGSEFDPAEGNPYRQQKSPHALCEPVKGLTGALGSIAKIEGTELFIAFSIDDRPGDPAGGVLKASFSRDLRVWDGVQEVMRLSPFWSSSCVGGHKYNYASVLDDEAPGRNFDVIGRNPALFLVQAGCSISMNRNLVRFQLHLVDP